MLNPLYPPLQACLCGVLEVALSLQVCLHGVLAVALPLQGWLHALTSWVETSSASKHTRQLGGRQPSPVLAHPFAYQGYKKVEKRFARVHANRLQAKERRLRKLTKAGCVHSWTGGHPAAGAQLQLCVASHCHDAAGGPHVPGLHLQPGQK
eukprot:scaffold13625_cov20-Tisochrysis_lutea.AAC.9